MRAWYISVALKAEHTKHEPRQGAFLRNDSNIVSFEDAKRSVRGRFVSNQEQSKTASITSVGSARATKAAGRHSMASLSDRSAATVSAETYEAPRDAAQSAEPEFNIKEAKKRARSKAKAERAYNKMYGGEDAAGTSKGKGLLGRLTRTSEGATAHDSAGPRAAVYKGEMGAKHRKAAAMQSGRSGSGIGRLAFRLPFGFNRSKAEGGATDETKSGGFSARKMGRAGKIALRAGVGVLCAAVFCAAIYAPAQQCYVQIRERDRLAAEYDAVMQRNEILTNNVETLQSNAGVEDLAHSSFGLVKEGENAGSVTGVEIKDTSTFTAKIIPGSVPAPDTWYSDTLDWLFGYSSS